jgi:hypothetical protein
MSDNTKTTMPTRPGPDQPPAAESWWRILVVVVFLYGMGLLVISPFLGSFCLLALILLTFAVMLRQLLLGLVWLVRKIRASSSDTMRPKSPGWASRAATINAILSRHPWKVSGSAMILLLFTGVVLSPGETIEERLLFAVPMAGVLTAALFLVWLVTRLHALGVWLKPTRSSPLKPYRLAFLIAVVVLDFSTHHYIHVRCRARAEIFITAIRAYERDTGRLPKRLVDLVPTFMSRLPDRGEGGFFCRGIKYCNNNLSYYNLSCRHSYDFTKAKWRRECT